MSSDAKTTIDWEQQIALIRQRFEAALRSGETIDGLEPWLQEVPATVRERLRKELESCQADIHSSSIETHILASDASVGLGSHADDEFLHDPLSKVPHAVRCCTTFQGLSDRALDDLEGCLRPKTFPAGSKLLLQGEQARGLHLILTGSVDIVDTSTGERIDCDGAGSVLGEMSLLTGQPCSAEVTAITNVSAMVLSTDSYRELIAKHPELEIALSQLVSDRLGGRRHDALCGKVIGGYELVRCINRGGMGVVYEARAGQVIGSDAVALKMLRHRFIYDDQVQTRFDQEAELLESLKHPNIVSFQEHFLAYRTRFLVLDLCDGSDLFRVLRVCGPLDEETTRAIVGQIAEGLLYAHQANVIHRDIKPGNILVDRDGSVRLTDFGLSKLIESEALEGKAVGTPAYMPPEQFRSQAVDRSSDFYALACVICEMLTAKMLFRGDNWMELYKMKQTTHPDERWPELDCSRELRQIICGGLQPRPAERRFDLEKIANWAGKVDGLFSILPKA